MRKNNLLAQQQQFLCVNKMLENVTIANFEVAQLGKTLWDNDFIEEHLAEVSGMEASEKIQNDTLSVGFVRRYSLKLLDLKSLIGTNL